MTERSKRVCEQWAIALLRECGVEPQMTQMNADLQRAPETDAIIGQG